MEVSIPSTRGAGVARSVVDACAAHQQPPGRHDGRPYSARFRRARPGRHPGGRPSPGGLLVGVRVAPRTIEPDEVVAVDAEPGSNRPPEADDGAGQDGFHHTPVLVDLVAELLADVEEGTFVDATLGGAGHAVAVLGANPGLRLLGLDQDPAALVAAEKALTPFAGRTTLRHARFDHLAEVLAGTDHLPVTAVLFDLGVSSHQLDRGERGFSHRHDAPLDMRMDTTSEGTAADVVNGYPQADLARVLADLGDERYAARIAKAVVAARPVATTGELADIVRDAIPAPARRRGGHPAKRSFQAIRIEVNDELAILPGAVDQALEALAPGGRCVVLAYHSGEDRIVKARLRAAATGGCTCPPGLPCVCGAVPTVRLLRPGTWKPTAAELDANPRAASARLRAAEKLAAGSNVDPEQHRPRGHRGSP